MTHKQVVSSTKYSIANEDDGNIHRKVIIMYNKESNALQVFTNSVSKSFKENSNEGFGGEVIIKRKCASNDQLEDATEEELQVLSTKARLAETAQMIKDLPSKEKLQWAITAKENANALFKQKQFTDAMKIYVECLAAADFGSDSQSSENIDKLVIPVVCNLAACSIELKEWRKVVNFCDQALDLRPRCSKALYRKGIALLEVGDYDAAVAAFNLIHSRPQPEKEEPQAGDSVGESMPLSEQETSRVAGYLARARSGIRRQREHAQQQKLALVRAFKKSGTREPTGPRPNEGLPTQQPLPIVKEAVQLMTAWELLSYFYRSFMSFIRQLLTSSTRLKKDS